MIYQNMEVLKNIFYFITQENSNLFIGGKNNEN